MTRLFRQTAAVLPVFLVKFMTGIGIGWVAPMLHQLRSSPQTAFTSENCAWIASLHYLTRGLCPLFLLFLVDRWGRNANFICSSIICFAMWIIVYASKSAYVHYGTRLFFGVGVGILETTISIYIGENCASELRGTFSGVTYAFFYLGEVLEFLLAAYLSYEWVAFWNSVIGFVVILSTFLLKEPAHFLVMKGEVKKAEKNYDYLHDLRNPKVKREYEDIKLYVKEQKIGLFSPQMYRSKEVFKSMRIVMLTNFFCMGCGFSAIQSFLTITLEGSKSLTANQFTILFGVCQLLSVSSSSIFMDMFNRRRLFLITGTIITIVHASTAVLYFVNAAIYAIPHFDLVLFIPLTTFSCLSAMFTFPITTAIQGKLLPQNVKAVGSSLAVVSSSLSGFLGAKIFLPITDSVGIYANFILFSIVSLIMILHVYFDLPETKGKTLVDIQRELKGVDVKKANASEMESCLEAVIR